MTIETKNKLEIDKLNKTIKCLRRENEQLKKELKINPEETFC